MRARSTGQFPTGIIGPIHARPSARTLLRRNPRPHAAQGGGRPAKAVTGALVDAGLTYEGAREYWTPRRLALDVRGVTARSADISEERKGPRTDAPEKAIEGFLRSAPGCPRPTKQKCAAIRKRAISMSP
jgi:hypothetical protein